jgi:hypothetical protein
MNCLLFSQNGTHCHKCFNKIPNIKFYKNSLGMYCLVPRGQSVKLIRLIACVHFATEPTIQRTAGVVKAFKFIVTIKVQNDIVYAPPYKTNFNQYLFLMDLETSVMLICYPYWITNCSINELEILHNICYTIINWLHRVLQMRCCKQRMQPVHLWILNKVRNKQN